MVPQQQGQPAYAKKPQHLQGTVHLDPQLLQLGLHVALMCLQPHPALLQARVMALRLAWHRKTRPLPAAASVLSVVVQLQALLR